MEHIDAVPIDAVRRSVPRVFCDTTRLGRTAETASSVAAGSGTKPLLFNNVNRPPFVNAMKGNVWSASEAKPDPTTQRLAVQVSAPIKDGAKVIGVIHTALNLE